MVKFSEGRIAGGALKLRIVHDQFQTGIASRYCKDGSGFKEPISHGVGEICALHIFHSPLHRGRVEEVALQNVRPSRRSSFDRSSRLWTNARTGIPCSSRLVAMIRPVDPWP